MARGELIDYCMAGEPSSSQRHDIAKMVVVVHLRQFYICYYKLVAHLITENSAHKVKTIFARN